MPAAEVSGRSFRHLVLVVQIIVFRRQMFAGFSLFRPAFALISPPVDALSSAPRSDARTHSATHRARFNTSESGLLAPLSLVSLLSIAGARTQILEIHVENTCTNLISDRRPTDRRAARGEENFAVGRRSVGKSYFGGAFAAFFPVSPPRVEIQLFGRLVLAASRMNQRHPQSRHTPHGGGEKPSQRKVPACKRAEGGLGQWLPVATADHVCPLPPLSPGACYLPLVSSLLTHKTQTLSDLHACCAWRRCARQRYQHAPHSR